MLKDFNDEYLLYYYEHILFPEDKSVLHKAERDEICTILEMKYRQVDNKIAEKILNDLIRLGRLQALDWGIEYAKENKTWVLKDHFPSFSKYQSKCMDKILTYFDIATSVDIREYTAHSILDSTINTLQRFANESEDMRDQVVSIFRKKACDDIETLFYLYRIADETYDKFFEANFGVATLREAVQVYQNTKAI